MIHPSNNRPTSRQTTSGVTLNQPVSRIGALQTDDRRMKPLQRLQRAGGKVRVVRPTGIVGIGGTGATIGSLIERYIRDQSSDAFVRTLILDTDETSQSGSPRGVSFRDTQFVHINPSRVRAVTDNIRRHPGIAKQIGLDDPQSLAFHQSLVTENVQHAGQVRSYGCLATLADWQAIRIALKRQISDLVGDLSGLERQLASENRVLIRNQISIHVVFSIAGGTGSSMALPVAAILRELTKEMHCEIIATMIMPSAFDSVLEGKHEQATRVNANAYATLLELEAARTGILGRDGVRMGVPVEDQCPIVGGLFNHMFVVGRYQADGRDLRTLEAVYDTVALHMSGVLGTEIADRVMADEANEASLKRLSPDPLTKQQRHVSSLGAKALSLDIARMSEHCAARQLGDLVAKATIGSGAGQQEIRAAAESWLGNPLDNGSLVLEPRYLANMVSRLCPAQPPVLIRSLFRVSRGKSQLHFRNRLFADRAKSLQHSFEQTHVASNEAKIAEVIASLDGQLQTGLKRMLAAYAKTHGWRNLVQVCKVLQVRLSSCTAEVHSQAEADLDAAKRHVDRLAERLVPMGEYLRGLLTQKQCQLKIAGVLQDAMMSALRHQVHQGLHRLLVGLLNVLTEHHHAAKRLLAASQAALTQAEGIANSTQAGNRLTTASQAELDLATPEIDEQLYVEARFTTDDFQERLAKLWNCAKGATPRAIVTRTVCFQAALDLARNHFSQYLGAISVVDVLATLLNDPRTQGSTMAKLRHLLEGCQPLWTAESGQLGLEFSDGLMIGIPDASNQGNYHTVKTAIDSLGPQRIRANGQYSAAVSYVSTGDLARIYAIRRVSGGCFHYLPEVRRGKLSYQQWNESGGHSVHIFNAATVAKMPSLIPSESVDEGELAFALAVAFGWVASRGAYWYDNLTGTERGTYSCRLASQWNCLAFRDQAFDSSSASLSVFVESGRINYDCGNDPEPSQRLGQGMEEAFEAVTENAEIIETIMAAFDALRTAAGDTCVVEDLERYCGELKKRTRATDTNYALVWQMGDRLSFQANKLR